MQETRCSKSAFLDFFNKFLIKNQRKTVKKEKKSESKLKNHKSSVTSQLRILHFLFYVNEILQRNIQSHNKITSNSK